MNARGFRKKNKAIVSIGSVDMKVKERWETGYLGCNFPECLAF